MKANAVAREGQRAKLAAVQLAKEVARLEGIVTFALAICVE